MWRGGLQPFQTVLHSLLRTMGHTHKQAQSPGKEVVLHTPHRLTEFLLQEGAGAGSFCGLRGS